jgi:hypothetical protein
MSMHVCLCAYICVCIVGSCVGGFGQNSALKYLREPLAQEVIHHNMCGGDIVPILNQLGPVLYDLGCVPTLYSH